MSVVIASNAPDDGKQDPPEVVGISFEGDAIAYIPDTDMGRPVGVIDGLIRFMFIAEVAAC